MLCLFIHSRKKIPVGISLILIGWLIASGIGFWALQRFDFTPGPQIHAEVNPTLSDNSSSFRIKFFAHPHCPCMRASLAELARLLERWGDQVSTEILVMQPKDIPKEEFPTIVREFPLPRVTIRYDLEAKEANHYRVRTSGEILVFDREGKLRFRGGITPSRGHQGPNVGSEAVRALLRGERVTITEMPVFGCPLLRRDLDEEKP
jgi:hypothetical protein